MGLRKRTAGPPPGAWLPSKILSALCFMMHVYDAMEVEIHDGNTSVILLRVKDTCDDDDEEDDDDDYDDDRVPMMMRMMAMMMGMMTTMTMIKC